MTNAEAGNPIGKWKLQNVNQCNTRDPIPVSKVFDFHFLFSIFSFHYRRAATRAAMCSSFVRKIKTRLSVSGIPALGTNN